VTKGDHTMYNITRIQIICRPKKVKQYINNYILLNIYYIELKYKTG